MAAHHGNIHVDSPKSPFFINTKAEILDFERQENDVIISEEANKGLPFVRKCRFIRCAGFLATGIFLGCVATVILIGHELLAEGKYEIFKEVFKSNKPASAMVGLTFFLSVFIPAMIGCLLVVFIEPKAAGGGIAGLIGYVNGVNTIATLTLKLLVVKSFSVVCCITAGLAGGMEGPMVHIGAIVGALVPQIKFGNWEPFKRLRSDPEMRDLVNGGMAAGIVGAFFSPMGGFVMALEEGMLYWNAEVMFNVLVCSLSAMLVITTCMSFVFRCGGCLSAQSFLFFSVIKDSEFRFGVRDMSLFILEGIIAGLSGALWNSIQLRLIVLRKKYVTTKVRQIGEMVFLCVITALCGFIMIVLLKKQCVYDPHKEVNFHMASLQMECGEGDIAAIGTLLAHTQSNAIRFLFNDSDYYDITTLILYGFIYFFLSVFTMGTFISAGIFIPNILLGSVWGRLYGELLKKFVVNKPDFRAHRFSIVGAAAQLCGVIRIPFTLGTIMVEVSGTNSFIFPIFVTMLVTTVVGNIFNHSIYHTQCYAAGMPIAETDPPSFCRDKQVQSLMSASVVSLTKRPSIQQIFTILNSTKHNMYPILKGRRLEGTIQRYQLLKIVKYKLYEDSVSDAKRHKILTIMDSPPLTMAKLKAEDYNMGQTVDLERFMNASPYTLQPNSSYNDAYNMMARIGVRHIIVVNQNNEAVGILTRKDIMHIREHCSLFAIHVVQLRKQ